MIAIATTYHGPTDHRGSRIIARCAEAVPTRKITVDYDDGLNSDGNHKAAAIALIQKLGWTSAQGYGAWIMGATDRGYVFVCDTKHGLDRFTV